MSRALAAALLLSASAAHAQDAALADPLAALSNIEAHACVADGITSLILVQQGPEGPVGLGQWAGAQVSEADGVLTLINDGAVLQIGPEASVGIRDGRTTPLTCAPATDELQTVVATIIGDPVATADALQAGSKELERLRAETARLQAQGNQLSTRLDFARAEMSGMEAREADLRSRLAVALEEVAGLQATPLAAEVSQLRTQLAATQPAEGAALASYRSEFFGNIRRLLEGREGVQVVGDRFVFSSEVLFEPGRATLSPEGEAQVGQVAGLLREVVADIPPEIPWVIRVDGHTDDQRLRPTAEFADNWELSQARALSVVRQLSEVEGLPPERLAANGFGEYQPIDASGTPEGRARNRRIEIKLTER